MIEANNFKRELKDREQKDRARLKLIKFKVEEMEAITQFSKKLEQDRLPITEQKKQEITSTLKQEKESQLVAKKEKVIQKSWDFYSQEPRKQQIHH